MSHNMKVQEGEEDTGVPSHALLKGLHDWKIKTLSCLM
jgi:hypothetical protein